MKEKKTKKISGIAAGLRSSALIHSGFPLGINPSLMMAAQGQGAVNGTARNHTSSIAGKKMMSLTNFVY